MTSSATTSKWIAENRLFIEAGGNTTHAFGLGRMIGRVFALLYLTPNAVSLEDMADRLNVSKASVSITVRQLLSFQAVHHRVFPGDRRDYYEAATDFPHIVRHGIMPGLRKKLRSAGLQIGRTLEAVKIDFSAVSDSTASNGAEQDRMKISDRLHKAQRLHARLDALLGSDLLDRFI